MENLVTRFRFFAIELPINKAKRAVPKPTVPPSALPMIKTVTSIDNRTLEILNPVRLCNEVIRPSRVELADIKGISVEEIRLYDC